MDRNDWMLLVRLTRLVALAAPARARSVTYPDRLVLRLFLWLTMRGLPLCRVVDRAVYPPFFRPRALPSVSQFCKRLAEPRFDGLLRDLAARAAGPIGDALLLCIDGKALPVTENTRVEDATTGHGGGKFCKGYRLHAMADARGRIVDYRVTPMHEQEKNMAFEMLAHAPAGAVILADGNYDSSRLYDAAAARGATLFTPLKGFGTSPCVMKRMSRARVAANRMWTRHPRLSKKVYSLRGTIERAFANLSNFAGGLQALPPWVRGLARVRRWVAAKLIIYHVRRLARQASTTD